MLHDRKSFDLLVRKYQSPIRGFFLRQTLGDAQLSDDLAQDTFVKAYTHLSGFRGTASFSTWLYRLVNNAAIDYLRREKRHRDTGDVDDLELPDGDPSPQELAELTADKPCCRAASRCPANATVTANVSACTW